jgi:hypothetical protein
MLRSPRAFGPLIVLAALAGCGGSSGSRSSAASSSAHVIAPVGAPYSYVVPKGFEETSATFPAGKEPAFLTLVVPKGSEHEGYLNAYQWTLGSPEKNYPRQRLLAWLDEETQTFYSSEGASLTPGKEETRAGHEAVCWKISHFKNQIEGFVDADSCAIVAGHTVVSQTCSWKPATRAAIEQGCGELRGTLRITPR